MWRIVFDLGDIVLVLTLILIVVSYIGYKLMSASSNLADAVVSLENSAGALEAAVASSVATRGDNVDAAAAQNLADRVNAVAVALTNAANSLK